MLQSIYTQSGKVPRWTGADGYGLGTQGKKVSLLALLSYGKRTTIHVGPVSSERSLDDESTSHILAGDTRRARRASH